MEEKIKKPKRGSNRKPPKIVVKFEPDPNFEDEFAEFVQDVLSRKDKEKPSRWVG